LLAEGFLNTGALGDLILGPGEVLFQHAIPALEIGGSGRQVGDTATIPALFFAQSA
jgi:hypothetical protein